MTVLASTVRVFVAAGPPVAPGPIPATLPPWMPPPAPGIPTGPCWMRAAPVQTNKSVSASGARLKYPESGTHAACERRMWVFQLEPRFEHLVCTYTVHAMYSYRILVSSRSQWQVQHEYE